MPTSNAPATTARQRVPRTFKNELRGTGNVYLNGQIEVIDDGRKLSADQEKAIAYFERAFQHCQRQLLSEPDAKKENQWRGGMAYHFEQAKKVYADPAFADAIKPFLALSISDEQLPTAFYSWCEGWSEGWAESVLEKNSLPVPGNTPASPAAPTQALYPDLQAFLNDPNSGLDFEAWQRRQKADRAGTTTTEANMTMTTNEASAAPLPLGFTQAGKGLSRGTFADYQAAKAKTPTPQPQQARPTSSPLPHPAAAMPAAPKAAKHFKSFRFGQDEWHALQEQAAAEYENNAAISAAYPGESGKREYVNNRSRELVRAL